MRIRFLALFLSLSLVACGGSSGGATASQGGPFPPGGGGGGGNPGGGGGTPPPKTAAFNEIAIDLGVAGAFPSDLVAAPDGTVYTVDDAAIPAQVVAYAGKSQLFSIPLTATSLIDHDNVTPARAPSTFGNGLFGAFTGDIEIAFGRWLFVTVGAGNSNSDDGANPLRLANLVVIDTVTRRIVQTINLAWPLQFSGDFSNGGNYDVVPQSLPSMIAFVPARNGTSTGVVYVAMSNGAGSTAGLATFYSGTVQAWRADFSKLLPLGIDTTGKAPADITRTFVSNNYNPVGLTGYQGSTGLPVLILTSAGASQFDQNFTLQPTTAAVLEFLDLDTEQWRDQWSASLGAILPAVQRIEISKDATGRTFGMLTSQTFAAAYVVDLSGLDSNPVDPTRLGLLRTVELSPGGATTAGSGFQPGLAIHGEQPLVLVTSFNDSMLLTLGLPADIEFGNMTLNPAPLDVADLGPAQGFGLGAAVFAPQATFDFYVVVNGNFDATFLPNRNAFLGTLDLE